MGGRFESLDANDRFVVVRDDLGYGVWLLDQLEDGEPIERFTDDDNGYEAAVEKWKELTRADRRSRAPWMRWLKAAVIVSAVLAVASLTLHTVTQVLTDPFGSFRPGDIQYWSAIISQSAFQMAFALLAIYIVLWLDSRRHR